MIMINLKSDNESETGVVMRIALNYIQILTSAAATNLSWPTYL